MSPAKKKKALTWVRAPLQSRSQETLSRILDATEALLEKKSFEEISVVQIAERAGSSIGSFYARFPDKESLLHHLQERLIEESEQTVAQALSPELWADTPLREVLRALVHFVVGAYRERAGLRRTLIARITRDPKFRARAAGLAAKTSAAILALLQSRAAELRHPDPQTAVDVCHRIVYGVLDQHLTFQGLAPAGLDLDDDALADELAAALAAYLSVKSSAQLIQPPPPAATPNRSPRSRRSRGR
jgi:AcrR family transcriptional regulator